MGINLTNNPSSFLNILNDTNLDLIISTNQDHDIQDITCEPNIPTFNEFITALCILFELLELK